MWQLKCNKYKNTKIQKYLQKYKKIQRYKNTKIIKIQRYKITKEQKYLKHKNTKRECGSKTAISISSNVSLGSRNYPKELKWSRNHP